MAVSKRKNPPYPSPDRKGLEELYRFYNRREFVTPDPLQFLYGYQDLREREVVGLIASSLAYGRVAQILKSVSSILDQMNPSPLSSLLNTSRKSLFATFARFKHRFTTGEELAQMLWATRCTIDRFGSLQACFAACSNDEDTILPALSKFVKELKAVLPKGKKNSLLPSPDGGSACKRLNLFLRWMVRRDEVDPGGWTKVPEAKLIIPLDTHMHRICLLLNLTGRKQADMRTAIEITHAFRRIVPEDPVRYDFALTRLGIRKEAPRTPLLRYPDL